jgi:hypothetical protein
MSKSELKIVSFDTAAAAIAQGWRGFDRAAEKLGAVVSRTMQAYLDEWTTLNGRALDGIVRMGKEIREAQAVLDIVASGAMEKKTFTEYAQSAMRAAYHGVPFEAGLKNKPELALPTSGKAKGAKQPKAGAVANTTRASLDQTLSKAISQARAMGMAEFAANLLDLAIESLDGFKEATKPE